ncbi:unnamed protein product [Rotaria sp. Silwood1]|nr:unnamed protein product [Rotaria sp. Silwood1]
MVLPILLYTCVNDEPIVPLIGQLLQIRRYRKFDSPMSYHQKLIQKHGNMDQSIDLPILFNTVTLSIIILTAFGSDFETDVNVKYVMRQVFADVFDAILYRSMYIINLLPLLPKLPFWKKKVIDNGTRMITDYLLHRRNDLWSRSEEFDYTRWMRDPKTGLKPKLPYPFAYLPFAIGP